MISTSSNVVNSIQHNIMVFGLIQFKFGFNFGFRVSSTSNQSNLIQFKTPCGVAPPPTPRGLHWHIEGGDSGCFLACVLRETLRVAYLGISRTTLDKTGFSWNIVECLDVLLSAFLPSAMEPSARNRPKHGANIAPK